VGAAESTVLSQIVRSGGPVGGPRWTLIQIVIVVAIISIIAVVFIGPCWSAGCRIGQAISFRLDAVNPDATEQDRINEALD